MVVSTGRPVDDGRTLVSNVRYRNPSVAGDSSGVEEKTRLFCISEARKSLPSLERVAFTASSLDAYQPALRNGESPYRLVCERVSVWSTYYSIFVKHFGSLYMLTISLLL